MFLPTRILLDVRVEADLKSWIRKELILALLPSILALVAIIKLLVDHVAVWLELRIISALVCQIFLCITPAEKILVAAHVVAEFKTLLELDVIQAYRRLRRKLGACADCIETLSSLVGITGLEVCLGGEEKHLGVTHPDEVVLHGE